MINFDVVDRKIFLQHVAKPNGKIGHLVKALCRLIPQPFIHLLGSECLFALFYKELFKLLKFELPYVPLGSSFHHGAKVDKERSSAQNPPLIVSSDGIKL